MHRSRPALAILIAVLIATGCGDDDDPKPAGSDDEPATKAQSAAPKPTSARAKLVTCIEREGFDVTHEGEDAATATNYTVGPDDPKRMKVEVKIHPNRDEARGSAVRAGEDKGLNAVAFGRAEFIRHAATDTEAGVIVNCVSLAYGD